MMTKNTYRKWIVLPLAGMIFFAGCAAQTEGTAQDSQGKTETAVSDNTTQTITENTAETTESTTLVYNEEMFTKRDFETSYSDYVTVELKDNATSAVSGVTVNGNVITVSAAGTYYLTGTLTNGQIVVDAADTDKVQLVLDGVAVNCEGSAALYVLSADKVFVTTVKGTVSKFSSTGEYVDTDGNEVDAAIFSKDDITLNGEGTLQAQSETGHGIVSKDDLKITSGTYEIEAAKNGLRANDSVRIADGTITIEAGTDGIHCENTEDISKGYVYIADGTINITAGTDGIDASGDVVIEDGDVNVETAGGSTGAVTNSNQFGGMGWGGKNRNTTSSSASTESAKGIKSDGTITVSGGNVKVDSSDDGIHSNGSIVFDGGTVDIASDDDGIHADYELTVNAGEITVTAGEGLEATLITINGGNIEINASDDGVNAAQKVSGYTPCFTMNDGVLTVNMGQGDTDAIDSNGNIVINGGTIYITAQSPFDYDGSAQLNGGEVYVNGTKMTQLTNQFGGMGGNMGDMYGQNGQTNGQDPFQPTDPSQNGGSFPQDPSNGGGFPGGQGGGFPGGNGGPHR